MVKRIILATRNKGKIVEINRLFAGSGVEFAGLGEFPGVPDAVEDGETFEENALKKAKLVYEHTGVPVLSEDSGLEVEVLGRRPGIRSARYAGDGASDEENMRRLLAELRGLPSEQRTAKFVSVFCLYSSRQVLFFEGEVRGHVLEEPRGSSGFGYDPVFVPLGYRESFAELGPDVKNSISHRANAIAKLRGYLNEHLDTL